MEILNIVERVKAANPDACAVDIMLVADALRLYLEAKQNIDTNGAICAHPRTGAPIENPYLKILAAQGAVIHKFRRLDLSGLFE